MDLKRALFARNLGPAMRRLTILFLAISLAFPAVSLAQTQPAAPFERDLLRLAEILGALHYLRPLCKSDDAALWREKMSQLIAADTGPADRRERLAGAFNSGHRGFEMNYRICTPAAEAAIKRYLTEGARLSREVASRHGG